MFGPLACSIPRPMSRARQDLLDGRNGREFAGGQGGSSRHAHRQLHDRTTSLPFKFELELISSLSGGTVKEGSPMTVESRIFSVAEYVQPSEGEPIRSVVLETRDSIIVVWHVHPGRKLRLTFIPHGQDTWTVLSGMADYFQGNGIVRALREGEIAVARPGQVHGREIQVPSHLCSSRLWHQPMPVSYWLSDRAQSLELVQ